jgi:hypothetical protein
MSPDTAGAGVSISYQHPAILTLSVFENLRVAPQSLFAGKSSDVREKC